MAGDVGPTGGTLTGAGGDVELTFPAGAVTSDTEITVEPVSDVPTGSGLMEGTTFDFGPDGLTFGEPVVLTIEYDDSTLPEGTVEGALAIHKQVNDKWELIQGAIVDVENNTVTAPIESFSVYGVVVDYCSNNPPISMGETVSGELAEGDCLFGAEKYQDQYSFHLGGLQTAFITTMTSGDYTPFTGTFIAGGDRVSGVIDEDGTTSGLHIFPAGTYNIFASSWGDAEGGGFPTGDYSLSLSGGTTNPAGCVPFIFVRGGVSVQAQISTDDCEDQFDGEPEVVRWFDGYAVLVQAGETVTSTLTADFPFRFFVWNDSGLIEGTTENPAGSSQTLSATAGASQYFSFYPISDTHEGTGGYTISFSVSGAAEGPVGPNAALVAPPPAREGVSRPR